MFLVKIFKDIFHLFYPSYCVACEIKSDTLKHNLCSKCISTLPYTYTWLRHDGTLYKKIEGKCVVYYTASLLHFKNDNSTQKIIHSIKYGKNYMLGYSLGALLGEKLSIMPQFGNHDFVIPLPLHKKKERKRGYNQSLWIAKGLAKSLGIGVNSSSVIRYVNNPPQARLVKSERVENVANIFKVVDIESLRNKKVIVVDDVATTGSTISSLVATINRESPTTIVSVVALATTG